MKKIILFLLISMFGCAIQAALIDRVIVKKTDADVHLVQAVMNDNPAGIKKAIEEGATQINSHYFNPLFYAVASNNKDLVKFLLEHGANPNFRSQTGMTPRSYLQMQTHTPINQEIAGLLKESEELYKLN